MITIKGKGVSAGVLSGPLYFFKRPDTTIVCRKVKDVEAEKARLAKAQETINETSARAGSTVNLDAFNKYEEKAERELAKAKATAELDKAEESAETLTEKYAAAGNSTSVDAELEALKAQLGI